MAFDLKQLIKEEYKKCAASPAYFIKKYCYIQHPQRGKILFGLYKFQEEALFNLSENDFNIILKSRQLGISTLTAAYALWLILFNSDKNVLVVATKQEVAKNLVLKVRVMYDNLPAWIINLGNANSVEDNKLSLRLTNGSQIKAVASTGDSGRSEALSMLIIDEAAFIEENRVSALWTSTSQTLATGGKAIVLSTPNGTGNWFHKMYTDAEITPNHKFKTLKLPWYVHPERDSLWRKEQDELLGPRMAAQECDCDFSTSGNTVIAPEILDFYGQTFIKEPMEKRGFDGNYWIWEAPNFSKNYIVCADVARGDGSDNSAFHVLEAETLEQVAEYKGQIGTKDFGNMLYGVASEYNDALLVIENANVGWAAIQPVIDRGYKNLYYSLKESVLLSDPLMHLKRGHDLKDTSEMIAGFTTSTKTRPMMIGKLEDYMRNKEVFIRSKRLLDEIKVFIYKGSKPEAQSGYNDDLVLAFCIGLWVRDTALFMRQRGIELSKSALNNVTVTGVYNSNDYNNHNQFIMKTGNNRDEDIRWLLK